MTVANRPVRLSGEVFGALINLSGRRRFTSQRVVLYAVLASLGHEGAIETARETLTLFREAHTVLVEGKGALPGVFCEQLRQAYYGDMQGDAVIRRFVELAEASLDAIGTETRNAPDLLKQLIAAGTPLLAVLNALTLVYEEQSKRHAAQEKKTADNLMKEIKSISRHARMVAFNAQIMAARAGMSGREFAVVAGTLSNITGEIDELVQKAMAN